MIDLSKRDLTNVIQIDEEYFPIKTDYRVWLRFWRELKNLTPDSVVNFKYVFVPSVPLNVQKAFDECMKFFVNANPLPRSVGGSTNIIPYDYDIDSDYIYAAFMQQYGIDLLDTDLHWHKFKALFDSITEPCKLATIIVNRCYTGTDKDYVKQKQAWEIVLLHKKDAYSCELEKALMNGGDVSFLSDKITAQ